VTFSAVDCESGCLKCRNFGLFGSGGQQCAGARGEEGFCDCTTTLFDYPLSPSIYTCDLTGQPCFGIVIVGGCDDGTSSHQIQDSDPVEGSTALAFPAAPEGQTIEP
jgi:hypothetical protein